MQAPPPPSIAEMDANRGCGTRWWGPHSASPPPPPPPQDGGGGASQRLRHLPRRSGPPIRPLLWGAQASIGLTVAPLRPANPAPAPFPTHLPAPCPPAHGPARPTCRPRAGPAGSTSRRLRAAGGPACAGACLSKRYYKAANSKRKLGRNEFSPKVENCTVCKFWRTSSHHA